MMALETGIAWGADVVMLQEPYEEKGRFCKDAYASVRLHRDMVANVDSSDYICRRVDV